VPPLQWTATGTSSVRQWSRLYLLDTFGADVRRETIRRVLASCRDPVPITIGGQHRYEPLLTTLTIPRSGRNWIMLRNGRVKGCVEPVRATLPDIPVTAVKAVTIERELIKRHYLCLHWRGRQRGNYARLSVRSTKVLTCIFRVSYKRCRFDQGGCDGVT
jgi:hypothetical protein